MAQAWAASNAEIVARVIVGLISITEARAEDIEELSELVGTAVAQLDPKGVRDHAPCWWVDLPPWARLDSFDRLRKSHDDLLLVETQSAAIVEDLRWLLTPHPPGTAPPTTPMRALTDLQALAEPRRTHLRDMEAALRQLRRGVRLTPDGDRVRLPLDTYSKLRRTIHTLEDDEDEASVQRRKLAALLTLITPAAG